MIRPPATSRLINSTESNASVASGVKCMASTMPVTIWITSMTARMPPKVHQ